VAGVSSGVLFGAALLLIPGGILSRQPNPPLYTRAWNLATLLFMVASLVFSRWNEQTAILTLAHLCVFLQIHKAFNYRTPRDYFQIWALTLMMVLLVPLSTRTPPFFYGFLLLTFLGATVWHLGALSWRADTRPVVAPTEAAAPERTAASLRAPHPLDPEGVAWPSTPSLSSAWRRLSLAGLLITILAFFCLPRPLLPQALRKAETAEAARARQSLFTGFSQSIDLRQISSLHLDPTEALRLSGGPLLRLENVRLRAGTLDWFDGDRWEHITNFSGGIRLPRHTDPPEFRPLGNQEIPNIQALTRIRVDAKEFPYRGLLTVPGTVGVGGIPGDLYLNEDGTLSTYPPGSPTWYTLFVLPDPFLDKGNEVSSQGDGPAERYLQIPERVDRRWLERLVDRIAEGARADQEKARRIETYLRRQGQYSLDVRGRVPGDGVATLHHFLDSPRPEGHCELFATSMALLCRAAHLPSRVATGFFGGVYDETEEELVLRYRDAHAWVEVWIPDRGWVTFDPTPSAPLVSFSDRLPFLQIHQWIAGLLEGWNRMAGEYGGKTQRDALNWVGDRVDRLMTALSPFGGGSALGRLVEGFRNPVLHWLAAALLVLNIAVILAWRRRIRKSRGPTSPASERGRADASLWTPLREALLHAAGAESLLPPHGQTLGEYLEAEARRNGADWAALEPALHLYESRRYGNRSWTPEDERSFLASLFADKSRT